jgi:hypothetical protein
MSLRRIRGLAIAQARTELWTQRAQRGSKVPQRLVLVWKLKPRLLNKSIGRQGMARATEVFIPTNGSRLLCVERATRDFKGDL